MPDRTPRVIVRRWFDEVWNQGKEATIDELFAPEGVGRGLGEGEADVHGPADFKSFWRNMRAALPGTSRSTSRIWSWKATELRSASSLRAHTQAMG